jgi:peptidyl-prolyl cis-trans isomerase C
MRTIFFLLVLLLGSCKSDQEKTAEQPVLVVNEKTLTVKEFAQRLAQELKAFDALSAKHPQNVNRAKENVTQKFINEALVQTWAAQAHIKITEEELAGEVQKIRAQYPDDIAFRGAFTKEGMSLDEWRNQLRTTLLERAVYKDVIKDTKAPSEEELQQYYKANKNKFQQEAKIHIRQIVVEKEDDSRRILEELKKGVSFDKLAREFSLSPESRKGGELGWIEKGTLEVFDSVFPLTVGKRSDILKSPYGFHIIEVLGRRPASQLNFDQAKASILQELRASRERETYLEWLKKQLQLAKVLRSDKLIEDVEIHTEIE